MSSAYLRSMVVRLVTILAFAVLTTVASAHAARMSIDSGPQQATHVGEMMRFADLAQLACEGEQHCGSADVALCEFVCHGVSVGLTLPVAQAAPAYGPSAVNLPVTETLAGRTPDLNERPPKRRLL